MSAASQTIAALVARHSTSLPAQPTSGDVLRVLNALAAAAYSAGYHRGELAGVEIGAKASGQLMGDVMGALLGVRQ